MYLGARVPAPDCSAFELRAFFSLSPGRSRPDRCLGWRSSKGLVWLCTSRFLSPVPRHPCARTRERQKFSRCRVAQAQGAPGVATARLAVGPRAGAHLLWRARPEWTCPRKGFGSCPGCNHGGVPGPRVGIGADAWLALTGGTDRPTLAMGIACRPCVNPIFEAELPHSKGSI
jgi:hypothetical protein